LVPFFVCKRLALFLVDEPQLLFKALSAVILFFDSRALQAVTQKLGLPLKSRQQLFFLGVIQGLATSGGLYDLFQDLDLSRQVDALPLKRLLPFSIALELSTFLDSYPLQDSSIGFVRHKAEMAHED
jgi:hypothetical protein